MPARTFQEWCQGLKPERKRPEKIKVITSTHAGAEDRLKYRPVFGGERVVQVRTLARRKAYRRPVAPLFSPAMEDEGVQLMQRDLAPKGYDHEYPCQLCFIEPVFPTQQAWRGYMGEKLEEMVLRRPTKVNWKRLCRHCVKFAKRWMRPFAQARGELRVRFQLKELSVETRQREANEFVTSWASRYTELRKELKGGGASSEALKKYRSEVSRLLKENIQ